MSKIKLDYKALLQWYNSLYIVAHKIDKKLWSCACELPLLIFRSQQIMNHQQLYRSKSILTFTILFNWYCITTAIAQASDTETCVHFLGSACGICGGQSGAGLGFHQVLWFSFRYHSINSPYSHIWPWGWTLSLMVATVPHTISTVKKEEKTLEVALLNNPRVSITNIAQENNLWWENHATTWNLIHK